MPFCGVVIPNKTEYVVLSGAPKNENSGKKTTIGIDLFKQFHIRYLQD
jgi:hypothetical protein